MKENNLYISKDDDSFMKMFLRDYCLRPSCYNCVVKQDKKSDMTIADFWGVEEIEPGMSDGKGCSLVIVRTTKGQSLLNKIRNELVIRETEYESSVKYNPSEFKSVGKPQQRESFFYDMNEMEFDQLVKKYVPISFKHKLKIIAKNICKYMLGGGKAKGNIDYGILFQFKRQ